MLKAVKIRLYPNLQQKEMLNKHFNACRFVYNAALNYKMILYKDYKIHRSKFDIIKELPSIKEEFIFLKECKAEVLQATITHLDYAFTNFYKGNCNFPKFKSKKAKQSFTQSQDCNIKENKIKFYKNYINYKCSERDKNLILSHKPKKITYSKNKSGQYFASILIETNIEKFPKLNSESEIGIDLGISNFLVTSNQEFVPNLKFLDKSLKQLRKLSKQHSKKQKGSKNKEKARLKLAKKYQQITNQRNNFLHNLSSKLINENQVIYIEDLNIVGMLKNKQLARNISDCSWSIFVNQLTYKAEWYGREIKKIERFYPSSKTCSSCGSIKQNLKLTDRIYKCEVCKVELDRDYNASLNILKVGKNHPDIKLVESSTKNSVKQESDLSE